MRTVEITRFAFQPKEITARLRMKPSGTCEKGSPYPKPAQKRLGKVRDFGLWSLHEGREYKLSPLIFRIHRRLKKRLTELKAICNQHECYFSIGVFFDTSRIASPTIHLGPEDISILNEYSTDAYFSVYPCSDWNDEEDESE